MNNRRIPHFEGQVVDRAAVRLTGAIPVDAFDDTTVIGVDDIVQVIAQFRCVGVHHDTDTQGNLVRVQRLRPVSMDLMPFDESNPDDDGILRAPKAVVVGSVVPPSLVGGDDS